METGGSDEGAPWQRLRDVLGDLDLEPLAGAFLERVGAYDEGAFVVWLARHKHIQGSDVAAWAARARVDANDIDALLDTIEESDKGSGTTMRFSSSREHFELLTEVGRGGMGSVFVAKDGRLCRTIALKRLTESPGVDRARRFVREVQITAQLEHPHIVPVYSLELVDGEPVFAMKLVQGHSLDTVLRTTRRAYDDGESLDNTLSLGHRLEVFLKVCSAVAYAHSKGVLHRDIKPANVMLGPHDEIYLVDWGVAHVMRRNRAAEPVAVEEALSFDGVSLAVHDTHIGLSGTPAYMSPEQAGRSRMIAEPSDQYALGLLLYELVTLQMANRGESVQECLRNALNADIAAVKHLYREPIPRELAAIIKKATTRIPLDRYESVAAMADDIRSYQRGLPVQALPEGPLERVGRWLRRHRRWALGTLFPLAILVPALAMLSLSSSVSAQSGERMVERLADQLRGEIVDRVTTALGSYLEPVKLSVRENVDRVTSSGEGLTDHQRWADHFSAQLRRFADLQYVFVGVDDGRFMAVRRTSEGLQFETATATRRIDDDGSLGKVLKRHTDYDPRVRPWYVAARDAKAPRWPKPYVYRNQPTLFITHAHPIYGDGGQLRAVFASDRTLRQLDTFLQGLRIAKQGRAYIVDRSGCLVAASVPMPNRTACDDPKASTDPLIAATAKTLAKHPELAPNKVQTDTPFEFDLDGARQLVQLAPFADPHGIDWVIVVALPRSDLTQELDEQSRTAWVLGLGLILAALVMGLLIWFRVRDASTD